MSATPFPNSKPIKIVLIMRGRRSILKNSHRSEVQVGVLPRCNQQHLLMIQSSTPSQKHYQQTPQKRKANVHFTSFLSSQKNYGKNPNTNYPRHTPLHRTPDAHWFDNTPRLAGLFQDYARRFRNCVPRDCTVRHSQG